MALFRYLAYLAPLVVGFGVPAALTLTVGRPFRRRAGAALGVVGATLLALLATCGQESLQALVAVAILLGGWAVLVAGISFLAEALRLPSEAGQVASGLVVVGLMGTVLFLGPVLDRAQEAGRPGEEISLCISRTLEVNPFMVIGLSIFHEDLLTLPALYRLGMADFPYSPPRWGRAAAGYAAVGGVLVAGALGLAALRRRAFPP